MLSTPASSVFFKNGKYQLALENRELSVAEMEELGDAARYPGVSAFSGIQRNA